MLSERTHRFPQLANATKPDQGCLLRSSPSHVAVSVSKNVRNVFVMASGGVNSKFATALFNNEFMTAGWATPAAIPGFIPRNRGSIGPELGIGFELGNYTTEPVMCLKSCIGDRALGWDLLPPGTPEQTFGQ